ncbi:putative uncharacterized protein [Firmicutes bacterium CAG:555]|jgi:crotonobetainyl-CoA:carnitine CoA-transferase CaiB-like acyl-CoA transferase|nr:putative uncharacterized protein [Firmicutes bacterium CAG:555]
MNRPLDGVKVIELSMVISAPSCGKALYEMGAEVIKVETNDRGDNWRTTPRVYASPILPNESPVYESLNSGKKHVKLNLRDADELEKLKKLIDKADVFLVNYRAGALKAMGLDYETLKQRNPKLVYACITGYGEKGPRKTDPGYDNTTYWAETGFLMDMVIQNEAGDSLPINGPVGGGDTAVGGWVAGGICAALYQREKTGEGGYVTCPLFGAGIWAFSQMSIGTQYGYQWPRSYYQMPPTNCPYKTADGDYIMTSMSKYDEQWPKFCYVYDMEELKDHPVFSHQATTIALEPRKECIKAIAAHAIKCKTEDVLRRLGEADLVYCKMPHFKDVYTSEQAIANEDIVPFTYESGKSVYIPKPPLRFNGIGPRPHTTCGVPGADNEEVFKEFGIE